MFSLSIPASLFFLATTVTSIWLFLKAAHYSGKVLLIILTWTFLQSLLSIYGFYENKIALPPRFAFLMLPAFVFILILFLTPRARNWIDTLDLKTLTLLHTVRLPVELTLYYLCLQKLVPSSMTFEGRNFDIISGITAPLMYYGAFVKRKLSTRVLLLWNILCLVLLLNIIVIAVLSAETPFQQLAFDQPNKGVVYFPYVLLPAVIVPLVLLSQLAAIRQLSGKRVQARTSV